MLKRRLGRLWDRSQLTVWRAGNEMVEDRGHRTAAQIAFFAVLSFVPLAMLVVAAFSVFFDDSDVRERVVRAVFENVPLSREADRQRLESSVSDSLKRAGGLGPVSIVVLLGSASGVMGALRHSINRAWDLEQKPSLLARKALDVALVLGAALILVFSVSLTATRRAEGDANDEGAGGRVVATVLDLLGDLLPFVFTALVVLFLYRVLPFPRPKLRDIWPGAVVAAALVSIVRGILDLYFSRLADLGAVYGSLGAVMALLVFVYAVSLVLVFGAEFASEWSRLPDDDSEVHRDVRDARRRIAGVWPW